MICHEIGFIIQNSLLSSTKAPSAADNKTAETSNSGENLDRYVIQYGEDISLRDKFLSAFRHHSVMHYVNELKRILLVSEDSDHILILNENFKLVSKLYPNKINSMINFATG